MKTLTVQVSRTTDMGAMVHEAAEKLSANGYQNFVHWDHNEVRVDINGEEAETWLDLHDSTVTFYMN